MSHQTSSAFASQGSALPGPWLKEQVLLPPRQWDEKFKQYVDQKHQRDQAVITRKTSRQQDIGETLKRYFKGLMLDKNSLKNKKVLDLGCGAGEFVIGCLEQGLSQKVYGLDQNLGKALTTGAYQDHFIQADFEQQLPVANCDYILSYAGLSLNFDDPQKTRNALESAINALNPAGEIRIYPVNKVHPSSDLEGAKQAEIILNQTLEQIKTQKPIRWELKPADIKVSGTDQDVWLEQILIIRPQKA